MIFFFEQQEYARFLKDLVSLSGHFSARQGSGKKIQNNDHLKQIKKVGMNYQINDTHVMVWFH